jgi:hypothetical protein
MERRRLVGAARLLTGGSSSPSETRVASNGEAWSAPTGASHGATVGGITVVVATGPIRRRVSLTGGSDGRENLRNGAASSGRRFGSDDSL